MRTASQVVNLKSQRQKVITWMEKTVNECAEGVTLEEAQKSLIAKAVLKFPDIFRGTYHANIQKASRWYKDKERILQDNDSNRVSQVEGGRRRIFRAKALPGRGRKRQEWVEWLFEDLFAEYHALRVMKAKITTSLLKDTAVWLIQNSTHPEFDSSYRDPLTNKCISEKIDDKWMQSFRETYDIVVRKQCGKHALTDAKQEEIERGVSKHLGKLARGFSSGRLDQNLVENFVSSLVFHISVS
ncbi:hypothetical protein RCL1_000475 [Eukaryota sp. TZLM3-RCL]